MSTEPAEHTRGGSGDLLIEIGTEELPPTALEKLSQAFMAGVGEGLSNLGFDVGDCRRFATPRRLAVWIKDVPLAQPARQEQRRGPALQAAFDAAGNPTKAAQGFARSCGVSVGQLQTLTTDKGEWLAFSQEIPGVATADCLADVVSEALARLPIPKRMRWGSGTDEFVRPVHWLLVLLADQPVPITLFGQQADRLSYGHRFHHPAAIPIATAADYEQQLLETGKVIADGNRRQRTIREQVERIAAEAGGRALIEPQLLAQVNALVEWPVALLGKFEQRFLQVPQEALITTMQDNQKYFPLVDEQNKLLPQFIAVANLQSRDPAQVQAGNERVIRPRFSDAEFFWQQDLKKPLSSHYPALEHVVFQDKLGSLQDKSVRVAMLATAIAELSDYRSDWPKRAAQLAKCDLLSAMVQEFPELQGVMGRYYALHDKEPGEVAAAIEQQYQPRFAGDALPVTRTGQILALAERLDTLIGVFAIGQAPSGAKDPFALRRAALGVLRLLIELEWDLDLKQLLRLAADTYSDELNATAAVDPVCEFVFDRLRGYFAEQGYRVDVLEAVLACSPTRPLDIYRRIDAIAAFRQRQEASSLAAANKRIQNILKKSATDKASAVQAELLSEPAEQALATRLAELEQLTLPLFDAGRYSEALTQLASLKTPVDRFFDDVMVMVDDSQLRANRLALLEQLGALFLRTGDLSRLQS